MLVRRGVNRGSGTDPHEADDARMRLHANPQNRIRGSTESLEVDEADLQKFTEAHSRQSPNPRKHEGSNPSLRIHPKPTLQASSKCSNRRAKNEERVIFNVVLIVP
ncbi:hypothetical protein [Iodidimonas sp. MBR-14]|jgi:hypothetical protein|uniref:hypothetical protein n=1 Tax=Iodidimonas sp. MBR-14 TaxID=3032319 RepID=UPI0024827C18|nr:hypothetical protein [Iodidimonas sp. MBR-14]